MNRNQSTQQEESPPGTWLDKPNLWGLGAVLQLQLSSDFYDHDLLGNFADNHDERLGMGLSPFFSLLVR